MHFTRKHMRKLYGNLLMLLFQSIHPSARIYLVKNIEELRLMINKSDSNLLVEKILIVFIQPNT